MKRLKRRSWRGHLAVITGLAAIPLSIIVVLTVEMAALSNEKAMMQAAADSAALAGAREMAIAGGTARNPVAFAERFALDQVAELAPRISMRFTARQMENTFRVSGTGIRGSFFGNMVPPGGFVINVEAVAETLNQQPMCILAMPSQFDFFQRGLDAVANGNIEARNCLVHANGNIATQNNAVIKAGTIQATGSVTGRGFAPAANSGALRISDPFSSRTIRRRNVCNNSGESTVTYNGNGTSTLTAGIVRNDILVTGNATLVLSPGEYYFCGGLEIQGNATLRGDNVVLIFDEEGMEATQNATISLTGRTTGDWAGFVIVASRESDEDIEISSSKVDRLLGTIYLPNTRLIINATGAVAEDSKWSVIVARRLELDKNARLVINSDYVGSGVPVPNGVGNMNNSSPTRLRQ